MIDNKNKLWKWSKPSAKFSKKYKKTYGLKPKEIGIMTDKAYGLYLKIMGEV